MPWDIVYWVHAYNACTVLTRVFLCQSIVQIPQLKLLYVLYVKLLLGNASLFNCILNVSLHYIVLKTVATVHTRLRQNVWSEHILVHNDSLNALRFNRIQSTHFSCIADLPICPLENCMKKRISPASSVLAVHSYNCRLGNYILFNL
jgi:hypothetical protein